MIERTRTLLVVSFALLLALTSTYAITGVRICGINYACGPVSDGVCPSNYCSPASPPCVVNPACATPDVDCSNPENSVATCQPATIDEDIDGTANNNDITGPGPGLGYAPGQSCNVCDLTTVQAAVANVYAVACNVANPASSGLTWSQGSVLRPGHDGVNLRWDCDGPLGASSCWYGRCVPP